jgi:hypothetical protein
MSNKRTQGSSLINASNVYYYYHFFRNFDNQLRHLTDAYLTPRKNAKERQMKKPIICKMNIDIYRIS